MIPIYAGGNILDKYNVMGLTIFDGKWTVTGFCFLWQKEGLSKNYGISGQMAILTNFF